MAPGPGDIITKPLSEARVLFFYLNCTAPPTPYLPPFLKISINPLHLYPFFSYKTLGITSQGVLKNSLAHAGPASGLPAKDYQAAIVLINEREETRTVSTTGVGHQRVPIDFLTGRRRPAFMMFPAAVRSRAEALVQPAAIPYVSGNTNDPPGKSDAFRSGRTRHLTGGERK